MLRNMLEWVSNVMGYYTIYCIKCHMVFSVTMVTFLMSFLKYEFTSCPTCKQLGILCTLRIVKMELLSWMIEICMENHLVSDGTCNFVNL